MLIAAGPTMAKLVTTYVVTALLLSIALFDLIECQRKVSRPLPSSSETKGRERANFDCPEEFGYYPHPSDCTQYYVCVFGGALLESCTGGLMYSHELQTCDWPRNVGCDGLEISNHPAASASTGTHSQTSRGRERSRSQEKDDVRTDLSSKYSIPPPPPPQPKAVVTTRGQPRQLQNQQEIIKQQLYADVEEDLPPAEEVESDRQQRVYRGQPSLVGQVQRDRDGYRHTNALPTYKDRGEKIGVISFGTQSQLQHYSTVPDLNETITNHITLKKRRKRQANRRRIPSTDHSAHWHAGSRKRYLANNRLLPDYNTHSLNPITYKADDEHFQPFIPNYVLSTIRTPLRHYPVKTFQNVIPNVYKDYLPSPIKVEKKKTQFREANEKSPINKGVKEYNYYEAKKPLRNNNEVYADYSQNVAHTIKPSSKKHLYKDDLHDIEEITERYETNNKTQQKQNYNSVSHIEMDLNHKPTINQPKEYEDSTDSNKADKDSIDKGTESKVEDPKNVTVSYEYYSEEEDDDLGPPEAFYNHHNKYKEIYNPFENPHFDFDTFLAKLGSTTSTTTKTTTTTKRSVSPSKIKANSEEVVESLRLNKERTNNYSNNNSIKNTELSLLTATLRPALQNIKPVTEHLDNDDYYDDTKQTVKNVYSSKIKLNGHRLPTTTASSDEYEYYYEEYDYPEPKLNNQEMLKLNNKTDSYAPIYSSKYHESQRRQNSEETKNQIKYLIPNTYSNITKITITTLPPAQTTFKQINKLLRGQKGEVDSSQFLVETSTLVTTRKPEKKVNTSRKRTKTQPSPSKTEKHTKTTPLPTTTEIYALDPKQEQSIIYISQEKNGVSQTANTGLTAGTATARTLYNSSQYNNINQNDNRYDPFYALYDEDVELYKDVDYNQQNNNNYNTNSQQTGSRATTSVYRGSPGVVREESTKRGNIVYNNVNQDIYQQPSTSDYSDNSYQDEDTAYRQSTRTSSSLRGDRNDINDIEDLPITTKRTASITRKITTTTTTTPRTTTAQARIISPKKSTTSSARKAPVTAIEKQTQAQSNYTNPEHIVDTPFSSELVSSLSSDPNSYDYLLHEPKLIDLKQPSPFLPAPEHSFVNKLTSHNNITTPKSNYKTPNATIEYTTKHQPLLKNIKTKESPLKLTTVDTPTTYSPSNLFLQTYLSKASPLLTFPAFGFRPKTQTNVSDSEVDKQTYTKKLKVIRKIIHPIAVNYALSSNSGKYFESEEELLSNVTNNIYQSAKNNKNETKVNLVFPKYNNSNILDNISNSISVKALNEELFKLTSNIKQHTSTARPVLLPKNKFYAKSQNLNDKLSKPVFIPKMKTAKNFLLHQKQKLTKEIAKEISHTPTLESPIVTDITTNSPINKSHPTKNRVSRVNTAIKTLITSAGTKGQEPICTRNPLKCKFKVGPRTPSRGRGTSHYTNSASINSNEVTVNVNRGTPAPRARPTLKPSTSIVSKASEFIDIYKFPPRRPDPLYPQPQPDKTAAKCRKDVCLLPDCSCGGKDIPGDIPVTETPQIVLMTFDDAVNDLNKPYYIDLFENGRRNPNGCPITATFYVSHEWTDYSQVQNLYADGHELASHTVSHSFGEQFSQKKWTKEVAGQREILSAYGGVKLEDVRGMRAPFLSVGGNKMFKMLYDSNFTYDSSMPIYENKPPSWPYTLDYKLFHDCMIPPCPTRSYPGVWEVPMVMWQDLNGGRCSMGDACSNPPDADGVFKMLIKNFQRHYTTNRAPFGLFYHAAWFTQPHHKEGFINFIDTILAMKDVWIITNWQALQWVRDPTPTNRLNNFQAFQCDYSDRPKRCNNPKVCNLWHKSGVRYMRTCQPCPDIYPWTGNTGIRSSRIDNDIEDSNN
ncbi:uncharacterized protein LOC126748381 isoform X2 [Anthonomus grandis grandis]|uniref:uncharacterized protein LOC126748381 isoform X2 n=2 Tax=Anthonomus grandis grandis TaxID=2921223 RepID=UPI0021663456|nr:uncharacterized protein LOC126748381 isoform X2 [Anthonomus grandis grandis]